MDNHKYKEGIKFLIKNTKGISYDAWYIGDSATFISKLKKGDNVELLYSGNKNPKLAYILKSLDDERLYSDFLTEKDINIMMGK